MLTERNPMTHYKNGPYVGRNTKCPCGSGSKFKKCHGSPGAVKKIGSGVFARLGKGIRRLTSLKAMMPLVYLMAAMNQGGKQYQQNPRNSARNYRALHR